MKTLSNLIPENYLKRFKIYPEQTLFPPNWDALKLKRCIYCGNKLKFPRKGKMAFCNSKKHGKPFVIGIDKLK